MTVGKSQEDDQTYLKILGKGYENAVLVESHSVTHSCDCQVDWAILSFLPSRGASLHFVH